LTETAPQLNLDHVRLDVNAPALHESYHACWDRFDETSEEGTHLWRAEVPLEANGIDVGRLELAGRHDEVPVWRKIAVLTGVVDHFARTMSPDEGPEVRASGSSPASAGLPAGERPALEPVTQRSPLPRPSFLRRV
jgi:UDP-GlcNAc:undecaprenyl-phosphate GlcNAc-1-phosphate transferase